jgi:malate dehydrogenase (oxaloacetate-decarboxylating)
MSKAPDRPSSDPNARAVALHRRYRGKIATAAKVPMADFADLAVWYTPGVAAASRAIAADRTEAFALTNRANSVAVVSDGSRVLGLGNIGPEAALPVMEGKALLFKHFGGVDAVPLCLGVAGSERIVETVMALAPSFGAVNLEDIATPKCFRVLDALREKLSIPVWHDDQQGTATAVLAGLLSALDVVGKRLDGIRIALVGIGAANMAVYRLLKSEGVDPAAILACDSRGLLHRNREDLKSRQDTLIEKWQVCRETNAGCRDGGIAEALAGADVCLAFSTPGPDTIPPAAVRGMAPDAIVFACANPVPEIWPQAARAAGARIVATGRSDFANQVNNALVFPGLFRGVLDVRARRISAGMARAAARALSDAARSHGLSETAILPRCDDITLAAGIAAAVGAAAQEEGLAQLQVPRQALYDGALARIDAARRENRALMEAGLIAAMTGQPRGPDPGSAVSIL